MVLLETATVDSPVLVVKLLGAWSVCCLDCVVWALVRGNDMRAAIAFVVSFLFFYFVDFRFLGPQDGVLHFLW